MTVLKKTRSALRKQFPKQARGRLVKAGANRNPWIHCDYFGFGFL